MLKKINGDAELIARVPALQAYAARIGAKRESFRRFVVEADDETAYGTLLKVIATITVVDDKIYYYSKTTDAYAPTKEEIKAINDELAKAGWPKSISATKAFVAHLRKQIGDNLFLFPDRSGKNVLFVQQRIETKSGKKYIPWSFWNDAQWRQMEPDGLLPLFGLDLIDSGKPIALHEGAKAAQYCQWLCSDDPAAREALAAHPWGKDLKDYAHVGWVGGANNAQRVDWLPIKNLSKDQRVVMICDRDQVGIEAATEVSREVKRPMTAVLFDDRFKTGFDLADDWPERPEWRQGSRYVGPDIDDLSTSTTWATETKKTAGAGRPTVVCRKHFAEEWHWSPEFSVRPRGPRRQGHVQGRVQQARQAVL